MQFIDSHAHLTSPEMLPQIEAILARAQKANVSHILNICTDPKTLEAGLLLAARFPFIKTAGATTPQDVASEGESAFAFFEAAAREKKLCAIGETGLDYYYELASKETQKRFLKRYLRLAAETQLPVIFHCRNAFPDLFALVDSEYQGPAIVHCFTGSMEEADAILKRGWYLSLSGIVTFKKSESLREVAKIVPLSQLLIETDAPFLAPQSHRGKLNEPAFLPETARCIAETKAIPLEDLAKAVAENAKRLFNFTPIPTNNTNYHK